MMSKSNGQKPNSPRRGRTFEEAKRLAPEWLRYQFETHTKEEMAEKLTTYESGVPHYWFGCPVEPLTKEEFLDYWNGGPEPEIRCKDAPQGEPTKSKAE
jgi:16S rRNA C967 or C1407 C5-methylase (RsmB/RsmF family)